MLATNEILTSKHDIAALKVKHLSITFKYVHDSNAEDSDTAVEGFIFWCGCWFKTFMT